MSTQLKSAQFRAEREADWQALEAFVKQAEKRGLRSFTDEQLIEFPRLYRATLSSLSVARAISLDRNLALYLDDLCERAFVFVYGTRTGAAAEIAKFFAVRWPQAVRNCGWSIIAMGLVMLGAWAAAYHLTLSDPEWYYTFMPGGLADGRNPAASTEYLRSTLFDGGDSPRSSLAQFASHLFSHNSQVAMFAFALGFALGLPSILLVAYNGASLGAFTALFASRDLSVEVWSWLLIHGVTELGAIVVCAGAGMSMGLALAFPGQYSRMDALARAGRNAGLVMIGGVIMLFFAGLLEAFARQLINDIGTRYTIAILTGAFWLIYFRFGGRRRI